MTSPYANLPAAAFWRSAMREQHAEALEQLYSPKIKLDQTTALMTAGSCFAQHLHRTLVALDWNVLQSELLPPVISPLVAQKFGHGIFSARYGNIYTARQLRELVTEATETTPPPPIILEKDGRYYDAMRPGIEPTGLAKPGDVARARADHQTHVRKVLSETDVLIFTLGLTEAWIDTETGRTLPTAPGTIAGTYTPERYHFVNFTHAEVMEDLLQTHALLHRNGWPIRILLTVSPVPLVATATGHHVALASTHSKSVLRAVCGELQATQPDFDYFPSFEIITTAAAGGPYYAPNMRDPSPAGVDTVLTVFAHAHGIEDRDLPDFSAVPDLPPDPEDVQCEEMLLEAFARK